MEELTEIITWSGLDLHHKPIALLNVEGYYDHFLLWVSRAEPGLGTVQSLLIHVVSDEERYGGGVYPLPLRQCGRHPHGVTRPQDTGG